MSVALGLLWAGLLAFPVVQQYRTDHAKRQAYRRQLMADATRDVADVLRIIGHDVTIGEVTLDKPDDSFMAGYSREERKIVFNPDYPWLGEDLLVAAAHECVHALFHQLDELPGGPRTSEQVLVEETAAYVLGAYLAGEVMTDRGGDGETFAENQIREYRSDCDEDGPEGARNRYLEQVSHRHRGGFDPHIWHQIQIHYGSESLVDSIDAVFRKHDDPWHAAGEIADAYGLHVTPDAAELPVP